MHVFLLKKVPRLKANSISSLVGLQQRVIVPHQGSDQRALHNPKFQQLPCPAPHNILLVKMEDNVIFSSGESFLKSGQKYGRKGFMDP